MKTISKLVLLVTIVVAITMNACKKEEIRGGDAERFTSLADFFNKYGVHTQTYTIDGTTGGSFTSPQGTVVNIPANAFLTMGGSPVTGNVIISFKDIYKKSDMLLAQVTTMDYTGQALKSGGEFSILAEQTGVQLVLAPNKRIHVAAPVALSGGADTAMTAYTGIDTLGGGGGGTITWQPNTDSLVNVASDYIYSLSQFSYPGATWINCDHPCFPGTLTNLTFHPTDTATLYSTQIFLFFTGVNSNVNLYCDYQWQYAPVGYQATMVAIGERNGKLYSSFNNITITSNMTFNFTLSETTSSAFTAHLNSLN